MATVTQVGSSHAATTTNTSSLTITKPTGVASGHVLVAVITSDSTTPTAPSGWVHFGGGLHGSASWNNNLYYKVAGGSEPSNYTWTVGTSGPSAGCVNAFSGVDTTDVIDGFVESESTTSTEPNTTPNATITVTTGHRMFYIRNVRDSPGGGTAVAANLTESSADHERHSTIGSVSSTGNTSYTVGYFTKPVNDVGSGTYNGLAITCDISEDHNYEATYALVAQADPASGDLGATLPAVTSSFAATRQIPEGPVATTLAPVVASMSGVAAPPEGPLATALAPVSAALTGSSIYGAADASLAPISATLSGSVIPSGPLGATLAPITSSFGSETRQFGEHVIKIEAEHRAFRVIDDDPGLIPITRSQVTDA